MKAASIYRGGDKKIGNLNNMPMPVYANNSVPWPYIKLPPNLEVRLKQELLNLEVMVKQVGPKATEFELYEKEDVDERKKLMKQLLENADDKLKKEWEEESKFTELFLQSIHMRLMTSFFKKHDL